MTERTFLIQRYATGNWPKIRGEEPFIVTGPNFFQWVLPKSLDRYHQYRFVSKLKQEITEVLAEENEEMARECIASLLLREGIVQALWADHRESLAVDARWERSVQQVANEIPRGPVGEGVIELLSGLGSADHYRSYVSEDQIPLVPVEIIKDGL